MTAFTAWRYGSFVIAGIDWEAVGGVGAAVGGAAAAVSAVAAWRAANASHATSRDALEALAVGIRPRLQVGFGQPVEGDPSFYARVVNPSEWAATDLQVEVLLGSGERITGQRERLDAGGDGMRREEPQWMVKIGELSTDEWMADLQRVLINFSDGRGIARYEHRVECHERQGPLPGAIPRFTQTPTETRIK